MRKTSFAEGEFYHIYNRGVDKRQIFANARDIDRFLQAMDEFNVMEPIGSIYENSFRKNQPQRSRTRQKKLVNIICYCLNPNHYHLLLEQAVERGIEKFMHRLGVGYTNYFNLKNKRSGVLFQGAFKAIHIDTNDYLLRLSAYINLNFKVHQLGNSVPKLYKSSWDEYLQLQPENNFCDKDIILKQFKNIIEYKEFTNEALKDTLRRRTDDDMLGVLLEN